MVGLSDIPCVGVAIQKISEATVEAAFRGLRYILCYKSLVNQLNSEIDQVKIQEVGVSRKVDAAITDGKTIDEHVVKWQEDVENMKTLADELSKQRPSSTCFKVLPFPNPVSRFRLGRRAAHQSKTVAELTASGRDLVANEVGYLPPVENVPISNTTYHIFASRQEAYGRLWETLVDQNGDSILGIYGMPGVGKTRMMEQAWKDAKDKNIFDKVARVNVSGEKLNVINLQDKLAASLDCHLESKDNEQHRASQLKESLKNGGKTLVVLDDVWDTIPLNNVGIPFGDGSSKDCKILLTSRKRDVCLRNNCKDPIQIKTLTDGEAWEMFQNRVGGTSEIAKLNDASLAQKVCKKCAALPLLIDAVANALKCATENLWMDALYQLENHKFEKIEGIEPEVYACLQLSFEKLNVDARSCLFLCSMFHEDENIEIAMLFHLATGSQLLDCGRSISAVIDILKSSSLLLEAEYDGRVKLHDIVRDVARSTAATDPEYAFLSVRCSSWLPDNIDYRTRRFLKLELEEDNVRFPDDDLVFPHLHTLWLQGKNGREQLSSGFFERFSNLKFLVLERMSFPDEQQMSIHRLEKLKVVILMYSDIQQTFVSSIPNNLETLCIWKCDLPSTLELPELKDLRKLELVHHYLNYNIVIKGISGLYKLEELKIGAEFTIVGDGDVRSIFSEVSQLTRFKNLTIDLYKSHPFPDEDVVNKLVYKFNITVGSTIYGGSGPMDSSKNEIRLGEIVDIENNGWMRLVERAEKVELDRVTGLANGLSNTRSRREAFASLRELIIVYCNDMKHVASWEGRNQQLPFSTTFSNLTIVKISNCSKLKYLFSASVAKCLQQMQILQVGLCEEIEEIIWIEEGRTDKLETICFPKLKDLYLTFLPSLTNFSTHKVRFPNMEEMTLQFLNSCFSTQEIELGADNSPPKLHTLHLCFDDQEVELPSQWLLQLQNIEILEVGRCRWAGDLVFSGSTPTFGRLRELEIANCGDTSLFRCSSLTFLQQLQTIKIRNCFVLEEILWGDDEPDHGNNDKKTTISLPRLRSLKLINLPKLKNLGLFACSMPALREVILYNCGFSNLFTSSAFTSLQQLSSLRVTDCPLLESIVEDEMHDETPKKTISLLCLTDIRLSSLSSLKSFSGSSIYTLNMPALKRVTVKECPRMNTFSLLEVIVPGVIFETLDHTDTNITDLNRFVREEERVRKVRGESSADRE